MEKRISILGSTGSIGCNVLNVVRENPSKFKVVGLAAKSNAALLEEQVKFFKPKLAALYDECAALRLQETLGGLGCEVLCGAEGLKAVARMDDADLVVSSIVGAAALLPTYCAIQAKKNVALANKETLVMAGEIVVREAQGNSLILPIDSEHSAIFQSLLGESKKELRKLILTASGGPFYSLDREQLLKVSPKEALKHPNWTMGPKITIDSSTLMNKGLEVMEAKWLFGLSEDQIEVVIHPQSIVHSMVEFCDGTIKAVLGIPDMRVPISYALSYPERLPNKLPSLDLAGLKELTFDRPDLENFPCLRYAYEAARVGGTTPAVLNAANEVAVEAFLGGKIGFLEIPMVIEETMRLHSPLAVSVIEDVLKADIWAREKARELIWQL